METEEKFYIKQKVKRLPVGLKSRVEYLLRNPKIGGDIIGEVVIDNKIFPFLSNCAGTIAYVYDIKYKTTGYFLDNSKPFYFWREDQPGYLNDLALEELLNENFKKVGTPSSGDIITINPVFSKEDEGRPVNIEHAGICIDKIIDWHLEVFEQYNRGGPFQINKVGVRDEWIDDYFINYYERNKS